jgi:hypothetical protein
VFFLLAGLGAEVRVGLEVGVVQQQGLGVAELQLGAEVRVGLEAEAEVVVPVFGELAGPVQQEAVVVAVVLVEQEFVGVEILL